MARKQGCWVLGQQRETPVSWDYRLIEQMEKGQHTFMQKGQEKRRVETEKGKSTL